MGNTNSSDNFFRNNIQQHFTNKRKNRNNNQSSDSANDISNPLQSHTKKISNTNLHDNYDNSIKSAKESSNKIGRPALSLFKSYGDRIIACNGDCGSELSQLIDCCVNAKDIDSIKGLKHIIEDTFWSYGSPTRDLLINLMEQKRINAQNQFYNELHCKLKNKRLKIQGTEWVNKIKSLLLQLSFDGHIDVLQRLANHSCLIPNMSLIQEINAYHKREKTKKRINKRELNKKINRIVESPEYNYMKTKQLELSDLEISSIILYCDHDIFAYKMRKSHREEHVNSCHWKKLFCHLYSAVNKIHQALHLKNAIFYKSYVKRRRSYNNKLYRGLYNVSLNSDCVDNLSLPTISSFTDNFGVAKSFSLDKGMILAINDAFRLIYNGQLAAANVSWISQFSDEREWITLPVHFKSVCKIDPNNEQYRHCIYSKDTVSIFEAHILKTQCVVKKCKVLKSVIMKLYWYYKQRAISCHDNMVTQFIQNKEKGHDELLFECRHLIEEHYNEMLQGINCVHFNKTLINIPDEEIKNIVHHLKTFLKSFDVIDCEKKDNQYINNHQVQRLDNMLPQHGIRPVIVDLLNEFAKYILALHTLVKEVQKSPNQLPFQIDCWIIPYRIGYEVARKKYINDKSFGNNVLRPVFETNDLIESDNNHDDEKIDEADTFIESESVESLLKSFGLTEKDWLMQKNDTKIKCTYGHLQKQLKRMFSSVKGRLNKLHRCIFIVDRRRFDADLIFLISPQKNQNDKFNQMYSAVMIDEIVEYKFGISYKIFNNLLQTYCYINQNVSTFELSDMTNKWPQFFDTIGQEKQKLNDENRKILKNTTRKNQQQTRIYDTTTKDQSHELLYKDLEAKTLDEEDIQLIKQKAMKFTGIIKPLILCISTQRTTSTILTQTNIVVINEETHKEIRDELMHVLEFFNDKKYNVLYDAIIVVLISICGSQGNAVKWFYDRAGETRNINKLKNDIVCRLNETTVLFDPSKTVKFENNFNATLRPGPAMDHIEPSHFIFWMKSKITESKRNNHDMQNQTYHKNNDDSRLWYYKNGRNDNDEEKKKLIIKGNKQMKTDSGGIVQPSVSDFADMMLMMDMQGISEDDVLDSQGNIHVNKYYGKARNHNLSVASKMGNSSEIPSFVGDMSAINARNNTLGINQATSDISRMLWDDFSERGSGGNDSIVQQITPGGMILNDDANPPPPPPPPPAYVRKIDDYDLL
eukprot:303949_1